MSSSTTASEYEGGGGSGTVSLGGQKFTFAIAHVEREPNLADNWQPLCTDSGKYIGVDSSELAVHGIRKSDEGNYRCMVTNTAGKAVSSTVELTVLDIGMILVGGSQENRAYATGFAIDNSKLGWVWVKGESLVPKSRPLIANRVCNSVEVLFIYFRHLHGKGM